MTIFWQISADSALTLPRSQRLFSVAALISKLLWISRVQLTYSKTPYFGLISSLTIFSEAIAILTQIFRALFFSWEVNTGLGPSQSARMKNVFRVGSKFVWRAILSKSVVSRSLLASCTLITSHRASSSILLSAEIYWEWFACIWFRMYCTFSVSARFYSLRRGARTTARCFSSS